MYHVVEAYLREEAELGLELSAFADQAGFVLFVSFFFDSLFFVDVVLLVFLHFLFLHQFLLLDLGQLPPMLSLFFLFVLQLAAALLSSNQLFDLISKGLALNCVCFILFALADSQNTVS